MIISGMNYAAMRMNEPLTPHAEFTVCESHSVEQKKSDTVEFT